MWLKQSVSLTDLKLDFNYGAAELGLALAGSLGPHASSLTRLDFSSIRFNAEGVSALAKFLWRSSSLTTLRLSYVHGRRAARTGGERDGARWGEERAERRD